MEVFSCGPKVCSSANFERCVVFRCVILRWWRNFVGCGGLRIGALGNGSLGAWSWACSVVFSWLVCMSFVLVVLVVLVLVLVPLLVLLVVT